MHNVQDVHKLSLVLVDALNLDIVQGVKWDIDASLLLDELLELHFVLTLDLAEASDEFLAVSVVAQLTQSIHITDPLIDTTDSLRDQLRQSRITAVQPSSWSDSICLVLDLAWVQLVEFREDRGTQQV